MRLVKLYIDTTNLYIGPGVIVVIIADDYIYILV